MANLTPQNAWDDVYEFATSDPIQGGPGGIDNQPHQQLVNRTRWLWENLVHVAGGARAMMTGLLTVTVSAAASIAIRSGAVNARTYLSVGRTSDEGQLGVAGATDDFLGGSAAGDVVLRNLAGKVLVSGGNGTAMLGVTSTGVRIGGATPLAGATLDVTGALNAIRANTGSQAYLEIAGGGRSVGGQSMLYGQDSAGNGFVWNREAQSVLFGSSNLQRGAILPNGRWLINKMSDDGSTLQVGGNVSAHGALNLNGNIAYVGAVHTSNYEGGRYSHDATYQAFYNGTGAVRTGYMMWNAGGAVIVQLENATTFQVISPNNVDKCVMNASGTWFPGRDAVSDLGGPANRWFNFYAYNAVISNSLTIGGSQAVRQADYATASFGLNGYQRLPSGLILQWGRTSLLGFQQSQRVTFPLAFPNSTLSVYATTQESGNHDTVGEIGTDLDRFGVTIHRAAANTQLDAQGIVFWMAIGY